MALTRRFTDALALACQLHANQLRKGSAVPYVAHLLGVTAIALEHGADEDEAVAAVLHDAIEDQGGAETRAEIRRLFGDRVAQIVDECSDADSVPKPPWRARKEKYLAHLPQASASAHLVSAADKLHNARSIVSDYRLVGEEIWGRFTGRRAGTLWYYRAVADALRRLLPGPLTDELAAVVGELEALAGKNKLP